MNEKLEPPGLFLSLPDPFTEFTSHYVSSLGVEDDSPDLADPLTHLSKFIYIDQSSQTDDGNHFTGGNGYGTLDNIG